MRQRSARAAAEHRRRIAWLRSVDADQARCGWPEPCPDRAVDAHELLSRARGGSTTDPDNVLLLCRRHHDWVTTHPADAEALGVARPSPPRTSMRAMPTNIAADQHDTANDEVKQIPLRLPASLVAAIDQRRTAVGELSRTAWCERALRWALDQPARTDTVKVST